MYKCLKCGKNVDLKQAKEKIICPYCGYRILVKEPPKTSVKVKSE